MWAGTLSIRQKIAHKLGRRGIAAPAIGKGRLLQLPLPEHPAQHPRMGELLRREAHQQGAVGVFSVPGPEAHAVGHHAAGL